MFTNYLKINEKIYLFIKIIFIVWTAIGLLGEELGFPWYTYLVYFVSMIGIAFLKYLITAKDKKGLFGFFIIFALPYLVMLMSSLWIWYSDMQTLSYISRGVSRILFQIIGILYAISIVYIDEDLGYDVFYGMTLGNLLLMIKVMKDYGVGTFINGFIQLIITMGNVDIDVMRAMEIHDVTFAFGVWMIYFVLMRKEIKHPVFHILMSAFFFIIGFKRIAILSVIAIIILYESLHLFKKYQSIIINLIGITIAIVSTGYVISIKDGIFEFLVEKFEVNTMGRLDLYQMFYNMFDMSIFFKGYGMGYTSRLISNWFENGVINHNFGSLHNDIMTLYIEIGFLGFMVWIIVETILKYQLMDMLYGRKAMLIYFATGLYVFLTYLSDNTHFYPSIQMTAYLTPILAYYIYQKKIQKGR